jgi:hypothetical protein
VKKAQGVKLGGLNAKAIANREEALARAEQHCGWRRLSYR